MKERKKKVVSLMIDDTNKHKKTKYATFVHFSMVARLQDNTVCDDDRYRPAGPSCNVKYIIRTSQLQSTVNSNSLLSPTPHPIMFSHFTLALAPILILLPSVAGHGFVTKVNIDGTTYTGNVPNAQPTDSPIRQIDDIGPVKGASNPYLNCGQAAQLATMVVPANPGSVMEFYWGNPGQENWPHNTGPFMTYMAVCDTSTCDKFNGSTAKWFKIDQIGKKSDMTTWYQQDVMNGKPISVTLPNDVAPGDYLVRHEIIALHLAMTPGGAEFYPSCTQIRVGGSQSGTPNQTVSFPGAYSDSDPGILVPDVYSPGSTYDFPGPPVSNLASPADSSSGSGNGTPASSDSGSPTSTGKGGYPTTTADPTSTGTAQSSTPSSASAVCRLRKRDGSSFARRRSAGVNQHKRRTSFARALRDAIHHS
ncbi:glycosyl hydrolase family 61-domain-containing protein [Multifurca ochricompacta]|uniref:lytic cellulose monooxygenase (C4-dehydrogenating) n=1 Tax=Multifurca ochricompacta TaxID=376703 RepID=A0AAD4QJ62_9AGAM|nr:glycosyl hydrolase family 61-domain-containing protein [Multifurca ochricompacta]